MSSKPTGAAAAAACLEKEDDFDTCLQRISGIIQGAFLHKGLEIGRELGLFSAISAFTEPKTSEQIAEHTNLRERYVREWLGAMVTSGIISLDATGDRYYISPPMARVLSGPILKWGQAATILNVLDELIECFKPTGPRGIPYSTYTEFTDWMAAFRDEAMGKNVIKDFVPLIPGFKEKLERGITVCDMGCGCGLVIIILSKAFPNSKFYGFDFSAEAIEKARESVVQEGGSGSNCEFHVCDARSLPAEWSERFDVVTALDSVHDQARPDLGLRECHRVLRPGGELLVMDVKAHTRHADNLPPETEFKIMSPAFSPPSLYMVSLMHCMPVSLALEGGMGLGAVWGKEKAVSMLREAGFTSVQWKEMEYDASNLIYICKK